MNKKELLYYVVVLLLLVVANLVLGYFLIITVRSQGNFECGYDWSNYNICSKNLVFYAGYLSATFLFFPIIESFIYSAIYKKGGFLWIRPVLFSTTLLLLISILVQFLKIPVIDDWYNYYRPSYETFNLFIRNDVYRSGHTYINGIDVSSPYFGLVMLIISSSVAGLLGITFGKLYLKIVKTVR